MRKVVFLSGVLVVTAAGFLGYPHAVQEEPAAAIAATVLVERGPVRRLVSASGRVVAGREAEVRCRAGARILTVRHEAGDRVTAGEVLAEFDAADEERALRQAQLSLQAAEARLAQSRQRLEISRSGQDATRAAREAAVESARVREREARALADRMRSLAGKDLVSRAEHERAESAAEVAAAEHRAVAARAREGESDPLLLEMNRQEVLLAEAQSESAQLALTEARALRDSSRVVAPIDGVVTRSWVQPGLTLPGRGLPGAETPIMTISDLSRLFVVALIDESDIAGVRPGQPAIVRADALPDTLFEGRVASVAGRGTAVNSIVSFEVRVELSGPGLAALRPEMTANLQIAIEERADALRIPVEALVREGDRCFVVLPRTGAEPERRPVVTGFGDGLWQEISAGLAEGETILKEPDAAGAAGPAARRKRRFWMLGG